MALIAGLALLGLALLSSFAFFGVLGSLVVPGEPAATLSNLIASDGLFRVGIAAFLVVTLLDVVVAWSLAARTDDATERRLTQPTTVSA